jgi:hypothetical protein
LRERIISGLESLPKAGAESAIIDCAANLEQKICPSPRPAHLLRFVHPAVHQKIGCPFRDRGADPQSGPVPFGIIDQPVALAGEIIIQRVQGGTPTPNLKAVPLSSPATAQLRSDGTIRHQNSAKHLSSVFTQAAAKADHQCGGAATSRLG